jgi:hypothetical protein
MKLLRVLTGVLAAVTLLADDLPHRPLDLRLIPFDRRELVQEEQLAIGREQLAEQIAEAETARAEIRAMTARSRYAAALEGLRRDHDADGCDLTTEQKWVCPK